MNSTPEVESQTGVFIKHLFCTQHHGEPFRKIECSVFKALMEGNTSTSVQIET